jgi:hypothetical protein
VYLYKVAQGNLNELYKMRNKKEIERISDFTETNISILLGVKQNDAKNRWN